MSRFAFSEPSIGSQTTRQGFPEPKTRSPSSSETSVKLLVELLQPVHDRRLRRRVDRGRVVAALAGLEHGLALDAGRQLRQHRLDVADRVAADVEPRLHSGWKSSPEISFGKKYVVFCGSTSPRRACAKTSSIRVGRSR